MCNAITSSNQACYLSYNKTCSLLVRKKHHYQLFVSYQSSHQLNVKFKVRFNYVPTIRAKADSEDSDEEAPTKKKFHFSVWKKWAVGLTLSLILPSYKRKLGPWAILKSKVDEAIDTVETVVDVVDDLAEAVQDLADAVEDRLPDDAKLKKAAELVEELAKQVEEKAEQAQDIINQVRDAESDLEDMIGYDKDRDEERKHFDKERDEEKKHFIKDDQNEIVEKEQPSKKQPKF